jgi:hypothetical protein
MDNSVDAKTVKNWISDEDEIYRTGATDDAVNCAKSMISVIQKGINPILNQYDYPDLMVKIGVDFGQNIARTRSDMLFYSKKSLRVQPVTIL